MKLRILKYSALNGRDMLALAFITLKITSTPAFSMLHQRDSQSPYTPRSVSTSPDMPSSTQTPPLDTPMLSPAPQSRATPSAHRRQSNTPPPLMWNWTATPPLMASGSPPMEALLPDRPMTPPTATTTLKSLHHSDQTSPFRKPRKNPALQLVEKPLTEGNTLISALLGDENPGPSQPAAVTPPEASTSPFMPLDPLHTPRTRSDTDQDALDDLNELTLFQHTPFCNIDDRPQKSTSWIMDACSDEEDSDSLSDSEDLQSAAANALARSTQAAMHDESPTASLSSKLTRISPPTSASTHELDAPQTLKLRSQSAPPKLTQTAADKQIFELQVEEFRSWFIYDRKVTTHVVNCILNQGQRGLALREALYHLLNTTPKSGGGLFVLAQAASIAHLHRLFIEKHAPFYAGIRVITPGLRFFTNQSTQKILQSEAWYLEASDLMERWDLLTPQVSANTEPLLRGVNSSTISPIVRTRLELLTAHDPQKNIQSKAQALLDWIERHSSL